MIKVLVVSASLLLTTLPALAGPASQAHESFPKTLTLAHATQPTWIEKSVALTEKGDPDPAVWGQETTRIREILQTPSDHPIYRNGEIVGYQDRSPDQDCRPVGATYIDYPDPPRRGSLDEAMTDSRIALLARVTGKDYGFYAGDPGQLIQVQPLRSYGEKLSKPFYYFFVPIGRFRVGNVEICKADERYAAPPEIGDEVFLFVGEPADQTGVLFHVLNPGDIVPVDSSGALRLPRQYAAEEPGSKNRAAAVRTKSDLLARLQAVRGK